MVSLLVTVLELAYASKIPLSKRAVALVNVILIVLILSIVLFVLNDLCSKIIVILDLSSALCILILTVSKDPF